MTDPEIMMGWMDRKMWSAETFLEDHGPGTKSPRPERDLDAKREDIAMFAELRGAYAKAVERRKAEAARQEGSEA
jgi:hypothetical protein